MRPRNVLVMLVVAVLCFLAYLALQDTGGDEGLLPTTMLPRFDPRDVTRVQLQAGGRTMHLRRRPGRTDVWELEVETNFVRAKSITLDDLLRALSRISVVQRFESESLTAGDRDQYGLASVSSQVELTLPGKTLTARFGGFGSGGASVYADTGEGTDVWVISADAPNQLTGVFRSDLRDPRLTTLQSFDVARLTIRRGPDVTLDASLDRIHVWTVKEPYSGYAEPIQFGLRLSRLVNAEVRWVEDGVQDLAKYGLDTPRAVVEFTPRGKDPRRYLVGNGLAGDGSEDGVFVMEEGTRSVARATKLFLDAVLADAAVTRDRAFSRLGIDGVGLFVKIGDTHYRLEHNGDWDVVEPQGHPAEGKTVKQVLDLVREWHTVEFLDDASPSDYGIDEDSGDRIEIERHSGEAVVILLGRREEDGSLYAVRQGDGGVERVLGGPVDALERGYVQFLRKVVRENDTTEIERLERHGPADGSSSVQEIVLERDVVPGEPVPWRRTSVGNTGPLDLAAVHDFVAQLVTIECLEWVPFNETVRAGLGLPGTGGTTCTIVIDFADDGSGQGEPPGGYKQKLLIGGKTPDGNYYAVFGGGAKFAFVLPAAVVRALVARLTKQPR